MTSKHKSKRTRRPWRRRLPFVPDEIRHIILHDVMYYIEWEKMLPGYSVYLRTTGTAAEVRPQLVEIEKYFNIALKAANRCEFGYFGIRVWRIA